LGGFRGACGPSRCDGAVGVGPQLLFGQRQLTVRRSGVVGFRMEGEKRAVVDLHRCVWVDSRKRWGQQTLRCRAAARGSRCPPRTSTWRGQVGRWPGVIARGDVGRSCTSSTPRQGTQQAGSPRGARPGSTPLGAASRKIRGRRPAHQPRPDAHHEGAPTDDSVGRDRRPALVSPVLQQPVSPPTRTQAGAI